jgi:2-oxoglutarate ferredoxin oxidoreductase subunit delta
VEVCPVQVLSLEMNEISEKEGCIRCYQCERYCPDIAIEVMDEQEKSTLRLSPV